MVYGYIMETKQTKQIGRPKGIPCSLETKEKIRQAIKEIWRKQKVAEPEKPVV
jgi:hypothetical protein